MCNVKSLAEVSPVFPRIPAKIGIYIDVGSARNVIPAYAGMTSKKIVPRRRLQCAGYRSPHAGCSWSLRTCRCRRSLRSSASNARPDCRPAFSTLIQGKTGMSNRLFAPHLLRRLSITRISLAFGFFLVAMPAVLSKAEAAANPAAAPSLFQPEAAWPGGNDSAPAFSPDGKTVFFTHRDGAITIMMATLHNGRWSQPQVAPFSGQWRDIEPAMAPDGSYLVFVSNRPVKAGDAPLTGFFGGRSQPGAGGNIWRVDRKGDGWGEPVRLPDSINSNSAIYSPAVAGDGSIYFNQPDPLTRKSHVYRAQAKRNGFETPVALSISDGSHPGYDVAVAPDESFLVFSANRVPAEKDQSLLFVAFRRNGKWTEPQALDPHLEGIEARLSPDLKTLYFEADDATGSKPYGRIFQVPLHAYIPLR
ncbi:TolB family protein [Dyella choica]|uniref:Uncharacterized protein n=1 Tax=Dyella choica TaxID=1927959 RepID=A0A432M7T0_9GAMM|nr:PD40 domain-containing protein [Dyella choica]RUL77573.1 hypothetical protein EKH80_06750 [Dyella choica]